MKYYRILSFILTGVLLCGTVSFAAEPESRKTEGTPAAFFKDADGFGKDEKGPEIPEDDQNVTNNQDTDRSQDTDAGNQDTAPGGTGSLTDGQGSSGSQGTDTVSPDIPVFGNQDMAGQTGPDKPETGGPGEASADIQDSSGDPGVPSDDMTDSLDTIDEVKMEAGPDSGTSSLLAGYERWLGAYGARTVPADYNTELAKFPESYRGYLEALHGKHPGWVFVAVDTGLDWNQVVKAQASGNRSLIPITSGNLLLSRAPGDYNASRGTYVPKDGLSWVTASRPAIAYYADPRNFLTEEYIYMFEALDYNESCHSVQGVEAVLAGTDLANRKISYINKKGQTVSLDKTYGQVIFAAGAEHNVSPLFLAAKIRQETSASLKNGSISGNFSYGGVSYRGYYNFFNIGATSTATGSAVANGLSYAKGKSGYGRPWNSPVKSIDGGAQFLAQSYIARGQNTIYFEKYNTVVEPYYNNQYMQNVTGAASEARSTYTSYDNMGIMENPYVFYIPVYKNIPAHTNQIKIKKSVKKGKTTAAVNLRKGPSAGHKSIVKIPKNASVKVEGGIFTDKETTVLQQLSNPYWLKVTYKSETGYISSAYLKMNADKTVKVRKTKQISVSGAGENETIYYESSNPAVATIDDEGVVKGVKKGTCMIYAVSGCGKTMDVVGITVGSSTSSPSSLTAPRLKSAVGYSSYIKVNWERSAKASGYYVYRKTSGGKWIKIAVVKGVNQVSYKDKTAKKGKTYYYTVRAYNSSGQSSYNTKGVKGKRVKYAAYKTKTAVLYRSGPGTSYAQRGSLKKGTSVKVVKGWSKRSDGYKWYKIYKSKKYYYVASKFLRRK